MTLAKATRSVTIALAILSATYVLTLSLFLLPVVAFAEGLIAGEDVLELTRREVLAHADTPSEAEKNLLEFRAQVEAQSYRKTLALCAGYRQAAHLTTPEEDAHIHSRMSENEIWNAWYQLLAWGLLEPVDAIFGYKQNSFQAAAQGIPTQTGDGKLWNIRSWTGSLYALELLQTRGFRSAAMHCLNTFDANELNKFARVILLVDAAANFGGILKPATKTVGIGIRAVRSILGYSVSRFSWLTSPFRMLSSTLRGRATRTHWVALGGSAGFVLADGLRAKHDAGKLGMRQLELETPSRPLPELTADQRTLASLRRLYWHFQEAVDEAERSPNAESVRQRFIAETCSMTPEQELAYRERWLNFSTAVRAGQSIAERNMFEFEVLRAMLPIVGQVRAKACGS